MPQYLSWIEGPPPKRNAAGSSPVWGATQKWPLDVRWPHRRIHLDNKGLSLFKIAAILFSYDFVF